MSETLLPIVQTINSYLSDYILFFMLIAVGLCYSIKTRFIQVRCFGEGMRHVFGNLTLNGKKLQDEIRSGPLLWRRYEAGIRKPDFKRQEA